MEELYFITCTFMFFEGNDCIIQVVFNTLCFFLLKASFKIFARLIIWTSEIDTFS